MSTRDNEVVKTVPEYTMEQLAEIGSSGDAWADAMAMLADAGVEVTEIADYGDGFSVVDKGSLVNVPLFIIDYKFAEGNFGEDFAIIRAVTKESPRRKVILTDGSDKSGLRPQMKDLARRGVVGGVICPKGLVVSEYTYVGHDPKTGEEVRSPARTYYFDMTAIANAGK